MDTKSIAKVAHEANRALCQTFGDMSQLAWTAAPVWQKKSAIEGVEFCLDNPDAPDSAVHDAWLTTKERDGWEYGKKKDTEKKTHPCMIPYDKLPEQQQLKDKLFKTIVKTLSS